MNAEGISRVTWSKEAFLSGMHLLNTCVIYHNTLAILSVTGLDCATAATRLLGCHIYPNQITPLCQWTAYLYR